MPATTRFAIVLFLLALLTPSRALGQAQEALGEAPREQKDGWETATPAAVGLDSEVLSAMTEAIASGEYGNVHAVLVERKGKLAHEAYFTGDDWRWGRSLGEVTFDADTMHDLRSVSKTVTSTLVGIALAQGHIDSVGTPVAALLPAYADRLKGRKRALTLAHLLTMSTGLEWDEQSIPYADPMNDERLLTRSADPVAFVLERPFVEEPGTVFNYSGGATHLLAAILEEATGMPLEAYARQVLFEPLGIEDVEWVGDLNGIPSAASGLRMRARDLAKIGSLFLHGGRWNGEQIVPEAWVEEATRFHIRYDDSEDPSYVVRGGYGYQWWYNDFETDLGALRVSAAVGNGGQRILLVPQFDMAVTVLAGFYDDPNHFWTPENLLLNFIVPSIENRE